MQWRNTGDVTSLGDEDKALIKNLSLFKEYGSRKILTEFSKTSCKKKGLDTLQKTIRETGSTTKGVTESGRPKHVHTEENVTITVDKLVGPVSHEGQKQTHCSTR